MHVIILVISSIPQNWNAEWTCEYGERFFLISIITKMFQIFVNVKSQHQHPPLSTPSISSSTTTYYSIHDIVANYEHHRQPPAMCEIVHNI